MPREPWPEVWHINEPPLYRSVFSGETFTFEDRRYRINSAVATRSLFDASTCNFVKNAWIVLRRSHCSRLRRHPQEKKLVRATVGIQPSWG